MILAGGGSGGHISPGIAIAEGLHGVAPDVKTVFLCSDRAIDATMLGATDEKYLALPAVPFALSPGKFMRFYKMFQMSRGIAREVIARENVRCVVALGGFVAGPVVAAAEDMKIPRVLINLDDPPGKANKWMAKRATKVFSAIDVRSAPGWKYERVGFPVRMRSIAPGDEPTCKAKLGLDLTKRVLLVTGASQGSQSLNQLMMAMIKANAEAFSGWEVVHLCGEGEIKQQLERAYSMAKVDALVVPFLHEMGLAWGAAELAVSRAGANSVAEVAMNAVPTVFLPYPYHKDRHQARNAEPLVNLGGAMLATDHIEPGQNMQHAGAMILDLLGDETKRTAMRTAIAANRPAFASREIATMVLGLSSPQRRD